MPCRAVLCCVVTLCRYLLQIRGGPLSVAEYMQVGGWGSLWCWAGTTCPQHCVCCVRQAGSSPANVRQQVGGCQNIALRAVRRRAPCVWWL
jgi:hypothetical protein